MGKPYSLDLRERIIGFVEGGRSRRGAADHFEVSASCAIKLMDRWNRTGSAAPGKRGGSIGKLTPHKDFLLARVKEKPERHDAGTGHGPESRNRYGSGSCEPVAVSDPAWATIQKKHWWQANKTAPASQPGAMSGPGCASRVCALSPIAWPLSTRPARQRR